MDQLWVEPADGGELSGEVRSDADDKDMEEDEEEASEDEEEDEDDELEMPEERPLKRGKHSLAHLSVALGAAGVVGSRGQDGGSSASIPSDEEEEEDDDGVDEEEDEEDDEDDDQEDEKEVIEILDDDEEMEDHEGVARAVSSQGDSNPSVPSDNDAFKRESIHLPSMFVPSNLQGRDSSSPRSATASARGASSPSARSNRRDRPSSWSNVPDLEHMLGIRSPSPPAAPQFGVIRRLSRVVRATLPLNSGASNAGESELNGKLSPEELAASVGGEIRSPAMPVQSVEVEQTGAIPETVGDGTKNNSLLWSRMPPEIAAPADVCSSASAGAISSTATGDGVCSSPSSEFPMELECTICFLPIAVIALFACGHGCCWECAHDWCSRGTSATMDCPTCHVSVPRGDFRRCVILDEVVERAVLASGCGDDSWEKRLSRGKRLAQEAEAKRRSSRDAQRAMEDTISEQAAELERLREEARTRAPQRRRFFEQHQPPRGPADYGFRFGSRDPWGGAQSQMEELLVARSIRHRRSEMDGSNVALAQRGAGVPSGNAMVGAATAEGNAAAAMAALSMPPQGPQLGVRSSGAVHLAQSHLGPPAASAAPAPMAGAGLARNEPWFSLRPYLSHREGGGTSNGSGGSGGLGASGGGGSVGGQKDFAHAPVAAAGPFRGGRRAIPGCRRDGSRGSDPGEPRIALTTGTRFSPGVQPDSQSAAVRGRAANSVAQPVFGVLNPFGAAGMVSSQTRAGPGMVPSRRFPAAGQAMPTTVAGAVQVMGPGRFGGKRLNLHASTGSPRPRSDLASGPQAACTVPSPTGAVSSAAGVVPDASGSIARYGPGGSFGIGLVGSRGVVRRDNSRCDSSGLPHGGNGVSTGAGDAGIDAALTMGTGGGAGGVGDGGSELDPLDVVSHQEEFGTRSEWDDVLAAVSLPQQAGGPEGLRRSTSPGSHHE